MRPTLSPFSTLCADICFRASSIADCRIVDTPTDSRSCSRSLVTTAISLRYGGVALTGGYVSVKGTGPLGKIETSGFSDPSITFHANFFGAPALRRDQYAQAIPQNYMSFHL